MSEHQAVAEGQERTEGSGSLVAPCTTTPDLLPLGHPGWLLPTPFQTLKTPECVS